MKMSNKRKLYNQIKKQTTHVNIFKTSMTQCLHRKHNKNNLKTKHMLTIIQYLG